jgi:hypothetical protein
MPSLSVVVTFAACCALLSARAAAAQQPSSGTVVPAQPPRRIEDNSFLVEEAYNQERGVVQHVSTFDGPGGGGAWIYTFTEEWPVAGRAHQLSYTVPVQGADGAGGSGFGDVALNYRYQLAGGERGGALVAPRATVILPTGSVRAGRGTGGAGVQVNLPVSYLVRPWLIAHSNLGATLTPRADTPGGGHDALRGYNAGQSVIWLLRPNFNAMLELAWTHGEVAVAPGVRERETALFVSPGLRGAVDFSSGLQVVPGLAVPIGIGASRGERQIYFYLSLEHPFARD